MLHVSLTISLNFKIAMSLFTNDSFLYQVELRKKHLIRHVYAGTDGTTLLTTTGRVLAAGSNENNKLGFNSETSGLKKHKPKVPYIKFPSSLDKLCIEILLSNNHSMSKHDRN